MFSETSLFLDLVEAELRTIFLCISSLMQSKLKDPKALLSSSGYIYF